MQIFANNSSQIISCLGEKRAKTMRNRGQLRQTTEGKINVENQGGTGNTEERN